MVCLLVFLQTRFRFGQRHDRNGKDYDYERRKNSEPGETGNQNSNYQDVWQSCRKGKNIQQREKTGSGCAGSAQAYAHREARGAHNHDQRHGQDGSKILRQRKNGEGHALRAGSNEEGKSSAQACCVAENPCFGKGRRRHEEKGPGSGSGRRAPARGRQA